jgi:opacity protein-like surface antigen
MAISRRTWPALRKAKRSWAGWTAKVEYLYIDFGSRFVTGVDNGLQSSYLRFGANYHF